MKPLFSIVAPAFNEASNLLELNRRLAASLQGVDWEWVAIDDHSHDDTFDVIFGLAKSDPRVHGIRLARNSGSHVVILCGLAHAPGNAAAFLAADLQDLPDTLPKLLALWCEGAQIVWAVRSGPPPEQGLIDRVVIDALDSIAVGHANIFLSLAGMEFRQACVLFEKQARHSGRSGWTLKKKIKLGLDSIMASSRTPERKLTQPTCLPIRSMLATPSEMEARIHRRGVAGRP